ncbi:hypothetical protein [Roseibium album]|uniref:hypothetical protein n=1 Tax=Roseibium album TaxID=311410 RepID=UPI0032998609
MKDILKIPIAGLTAIMLLAGADTAKAGCSDGFLANLACEIGIIDKKTANDLDRAHAQAGAPLNKVPSVVLEGVYPGLGTVYEANQRLIKLKDRLGSRQQRASRGFENRRFERPAKRLYRR